MASRTLFRVFYRLGFTPWDGHPIQKNLTALIEGGPTTPALPPEAALDLGCGTGDTSVYLAEHGWRVTGVDFVARPLRTARAKAAAGNLTIDFVQADVTKLRGSDVGTGFSLIVDTGCLHNLPADQRDTYIQEVTAVAAREALLFIVGYRPDTQRGVFGITEAELQQRVSPEWQIVSVGEPGADDDAPLYDYLFRRSA